MSAEKMTARPVPELCRTWDPPAASTVKDPTSCLLYAHSARGREGNLRARTACELLSQSLCGELDVTSSMQARQSYIQKGKYQFIWCPRCMFCSSTRLWMRARSPSTWSVRCFGFCLNGFHQCLRCSDHFFRLYHYSWVDSVSNKHNPSAKSGLDACVSSSRTIESSKKTTQNKIN